MYGERRERLRQHPQPSTWEIPTVLGACLLIAMGIAPLCAQAAVGVAVTGRLVWPDGHLLDALLGVSRGRFGVGLSEHDAGALPSGAVLWTATALLELMVLTVGVLAAVNWSAAVGNGGPRGLATPRQATAALGTRKLRTRARVIRPDLRRRRSTSRHTVLSGGAKTRNGRAAHRPSSRERS